jgi:succinoglycan biosynthesis transport protein ExoP
MFDAENHGRGRRESSLLSLGRARPDEAASHTPKSLSAFPAADDDTDPATRHRLARLRREAAPNPLLGALSEKLDAKEDRPIAEAHQQNASARNPESRVRWSISDLVPGRHSRRPEKKELEHAEEEWADFDRAAVKTSGNMRRRGEDGLSLRDAAQSPVDRRPLSVSDNPDLYWRPLIDPMRVVMGVANSKMLILTTTMLGALLGIAIAVSTPKKYEGVAELLIDPRDLKIVDRDLTQSGLPSDATMAIVENQVRVLTSGTVLNKVVDKLNLTSDPEFNGQGAGFIVNPISVLRSLASGDSGGDGDNRRALAVGNLAESLTVERGGKTFVVVITATTQNPEKSALIANTLTDVFLQTYGQIQSEAAGRAADELTSRLDQLRADVETAERKVEAYKAENDIIDAQGRLISDDEMVKLNEQLSIARARTIELNARSASARELDVNAVLSGTLPEQINSNVMTELRSQYAGLKQEADRLAVRLGPRHPQRLAIEAQLAGAREQIQTELRRIILSNQVELKRAVQLEQDLASRLAQVKVRQGGVSEDLVTLRELEREAAAKRAVYESFLLRARETGEQRDLNTANMSVISKAYPPLEPVGPSRSTIALTGMILGFMAGVGIGGARGAIQSLRDNANPQGPRSPSPSGSPNGGGRRHERQRRTPETEPTPLRQEPSSYARRGTVASWSEASPERNGVGTNPEAVTTPHADRNTSQPAFWAGPAGSAPAVSRTSIDEVRESLRELREAVLHVAQNRARRRHS